MPRACLSLLGASAGAVPSSMEARSRAGWGKGISRCPLAGWGRRGRNEEVGGLGFPISRVEGGGCVMLVPISDSRPWWED